MPKLDNVVQNAATTIRAEFEAWSPGTNYEAGDLVVFDGDTFAAQAKHFIDDLPGFIQKINDRFS